MYEVIRWISLVMLWCACGLNIFAMIRLSRTQRELENQVRIWKARNKYDEENNDG